MTDKEITPYIRKQLLFLSIVGFCAITIFKLFQMQIINYYAYEVKSNDNSIKEILIDAPRGIFYDRNKEILVSNKPSFTLQITPSLYDTSLTPLIEAFIEEKKGYINEILKENAKLPPHYPIKIKRKINFRTVAWVDENENNLSGVSYKVEMQRDYSFGVNASHVFGYTKEISEQAWKKNKDKYAIGDYIGFNGIEKTYEKYLRGEKGSQYFLVDSRQHVIGKYLDGKNDKPFVKGKDLILTIDKSAQIAAEKAFENKKGSLIAIEPSTGEILAYVSAPWYNLEKFASVTSKEIWSKLQSDPDKPLFNRPIMSKVPPGSTSKPLPALIALQEKIITPYTTEFCGGGVQFGNRYFLCHGGSHGNLTVVQAIERSCNSFFYRLIFDIGLNRWSKYAKEMGFGVKTEIDIDGEVVGIVPSEKYYNKIYGKKGRDWTDGLLMNISIGQGEFNVTPIQLAQYISLIANEGITHQPHFVKGYTTGLLNEVVDLSFPKKKVHIDKKNFEIIKEAMYKVVFGERGTARNIRMKDLEIAGKTGTSQNPHGKDHALFIGFAPYENPKIAVAVMVENVGFGSTHAAPIAQEVIKAYLKKQDTKQL